VEKSGLAVRLESSAQLADGDVDDIRDRIALNTPDGLEELIAFEHLTLVTQEVLQHIELQRRQLDGAIAAADLVRSDVHDKVGAVEDLATRGLAPAKKCAHSRKELVVREGFDEIVVSAGVQSIDAVGYGVAGGEHQDRHVGSRAQAPADFDAIEAGQHDVKDDEIRRPIARGDERAGTVGRDLHGVSFICQRPPERRSEAGVVVHHEDLSAHPA
jgi:hypothetical protein